MGICNFFGGKWNLISLAMNVQVFMGFLSRFINEFYPDAASVLGLDLANVDAEWISWLEGQGHNTKRPPQDLSRSYCGRSRTANFLTSVYNDIARLTDLRPEWEKDVWDIRNLGDYNIRQAKNLNHYTLNFSQVENPHFRDFLKLYVKNRILNTQIAWETAQNYIKYVPKFMNFISSEEPAWEDLRGLDRRHIEKYLVAVNIHMRDKLKRSNAYPQHYKKQCLSIVEKFLSDIQGLELKFAPAKSVEALIMPGDKPSIGRDRYRSVVYIPDFVLEQLFANINKMNPKIIPVIWIVFKTGLRIADVLALTYDCLMKVDGKFWLKTDIQKVGIIDYKLPIDDELAAMIGELIATRKREIAKRDNPLEYLFSKTTGSRKGRPYHSSFIRKELNVFAAECAIVDEMGKPYHFTNHIFRHTFGVKMLNSGADIFTVQELLAHASPEMTAVYAKLDNKRIAFENAVKSGVFSFSDSGGGLREVETGELPRDVLDRLWLNHRLEAIDTPYGTCLRRAGGACEFAKFPPCLIGDGGRPCKDLCIGAFEGDRLKYEVLISSASALAEQARIHGRERMAAENAELLRLYQSVYDTVSEGNIIYGRIDRLRG